MTFREKVEKTRSIKDCFMPGLKALTEQYKNKINAKETRKINGSIFLEECINGAVWDYIIGYKNETFFVEVHPAVTSEINNVLRKLFWLKHWKSKTFFKNDNNFFWLATNGIHILPRSNYWKRIHEQGLEVKNILILK